MLTDLAMKFVSFVDFMELVQRRQFVCGQRLLLQEFLCRMRNQGFFGAAMLPMSELEYTGITERLEELEARFQNR